MKTALRWLTNRVGHRGACLLFFALLDTVNGLSLAFPSREALRQKTALAFVGSVLPLWLWAALWITAGLCCLVDAFRYDDRIGFAAAMLVKSLWCLMYLAATFRHVFDRAYLGAAVWGSLALLVGILSTWPEPPSREHRQILAALARRREGG